jgi:hypothetical protein
MDRVTAAQSSSPAPTRRPVNARLAAWRAAGDRSAYRSLPAATWPASRTQAGGPELLRASDATEDGKPLNVSPTQSPSGCAEVGGASIDARFGNRGRRVGALPASRGRSSVEVRRLPVQPPSGRLDWPAIASWLECVKPEDLEGLGRLGEVLHFCLEHGAVACGMASEPA